jgi:hypothetical protein
MIRFVAGCIVGALGGLYVIGIFLMSSTESTTEARGHISFHWAESPLT